MPDKTYSLSDAPQSGAQAPPDEARAVLDRFFALSPDLLCISGFDGRFKRVSAAFEQVLGYSQEELLALPVSALIHPDDLQQTMRLSQQLERGEPVHIDNRYRRKDGGIRWLSWTARASLADQLIYATARDVTAQKRVEERMIAQRRILEMIAADQPLQDTLGAIARACEAQAPALLAMICVVAPDRVHLRPTAAPSVPPGYLSTMTNLRIGPETCALAAAAHLREQVTSTDIASDTRWAHAHRSAALEHGIRAVVTRPLLGPHGDVVAVFGAFLREPRAPTQVESEVIASKAHLAAIAVVRRRQEDEVRLLRKAVSHFHDIVMITDVEPPDRGGPHILFVNEAFERITGWKREEVLGATPRFMMGPSTPPEAVARLAHALQTFQPIHDEVVNYTKSGQEIWCDSDIVPMADESGVFTHWVAIERDITARKKLEEQFFQSQKMEAVGRLAGGIAHDFNNMLTVIRGIGEIVLSELSEEDPLRSDMAEIARAAERATALTRQLLAFSRKQVLNPQVVLLNTLVGEMDKLLRRVIGEDINLATRLAPDLAMVKADPGQIEQVVMNLVVNARDAMPSGGKLTLETANVELDEAYAKHHLDTKPGPHVLLAVSDTGVGMDRAVRERIFDPFFTTKEKGKGTGLGLSTVYGIVKQSGGHIGVYSEIGQGTTFKIYLPVTNEKPLSASTPRVPALSLRGHETVLLVEDDASVRQVTRHGLARSGYVVLEAASGDEAMTIVNQHRGPIHLLVTDVVLPGMGGQQIAAKLTASRPEMRVLFMSGYTENALEHREGLADGSAFLEKPFSLNALSQKVRDVLDGKEEAPTIP